MEPRPPEGSTRDRILWAAVTMLGEAPGSIMSVRTIAARAGVSTGALQHHFPVKQQLIDEAMAIVYDLVLPENYLDDTSIPPRDRLIAYLRQIMSPPEIDLSPRRAWQMTYERYLSPAAPAGADAEFLAIERELCRRIEHCLIALQNEGAIPTGRTARTARALLTLIHGLGVARALPHDESLATTETDILNAAADLVLTAHRSAEEVSEV